MSDYIMKDGRKVRACKFTCGTTVAFDEKLNYFVEVDHENVQHTKERCLAFKEKQTKKEPTDREDKIARIIKMIEAVVGELEDLKNEK